MSKLVVVASKNPVKVNASVEGFAKMLPKEDFAFRSIDVSSDVSDQPMTDEETLKGATNRAKNAQKEEPEADFWVGIEGGIQDTDHGMMAFAWVVILSADQEGRSRTSTFHLPPKVKELIHQGVELGYANDQVFGEKNSKHKGGAVGSLTGGELNRTEYYVQPVLLALVPFVNPDLY
jgi:inosine/xanthosine triphosphatase